MIARATVPNADPYLLPMAGLLTAVGLTEIYRLDPTDAFRQGALDRDRRRALRRRADLAAPRLPRARVVQVPVRRRRDRAALPAAAARDRHDRQRRAALGARRLVPVPAGRAREDLADRLPRRLPAREARGARPGPAEGPRPAAPDLGRGDARPRRDERPRLGAPLLRDLPRDALHRDRAPLVRRGRARALRRRRLRRRPRDRARPRADHDLAPAVDEPQGLLPADRRRSRCGRTARATSS